MAKTYYSVPDKSVGNTFTEQMWDESIRANINNLRVPAACRVYASASQTVPDASAYTVLFDSEDFDTDSMHSTSSNTGRITFPTAGMYLVGCDMGFNANATGNRIVNIMRNGSTSIAGASADNIGGTNWVQLQCVTLASFSAAQYVTFEAYQSSGSGLDLLLTVTRAWAVWVGQTS